MPDDVRADDTLSLILREVRGSRVEIARSQRGRDQA